MVRPVYAGLQVGLGVDGNASHAATLWSKTAMLSEQLSGRDCDHASLGDLLLDYRIDDDLWRNPPLSARSFVDEEAEVRKHHNRQVDSRQE